MRRSALLVVLGLLVAGCATAAGVPEPTAATTGPPALTSSPASSLAATQAPTSASEAGRVRAEVISVTDGDTIRVRIDGQSIPVRYIGIDTPETVGPRQDVQCFGREASAFNAQLVGGKVVELEKDVSETDRFGRLLRYVYVDGKMVNEELVRGGFATSSSYPPDVKYQDRLRTLEAHARANGAGLWAANACALATSPPTRAPTAAPASTTAPTPAPTTRGVAPTAAPTTAQATSAPRSNCDAAYPTVCIPPPPPDLDCGEIPYRRFQVLPPDPHRLDGNDNDGIGCES